MARPGRPERNRTARSFRQLRRFHHVINSDKVFGTHSGPDQASPCWSYLNLVRDGRIQIFHKTASSLKHYTSIPCSLAVSSRFILLAAVRERRRRLCV